MTKEEFAANVAKLVAAMQVPVSIMGTNTVLGAGERAWQELMHAATGGFGWASTEKLEAEFRKLLDLKPKVPVRECDQGELLPACQGQCEQPGEWGATGIMPPGHIWQWRDGLHTSGYLAHIPESEETETTS